MAGACKKLLNIATSIAVTIIGVLLIACTHTNYSVLATGYAQLKQVRINLVEMVSLNYFATAIFIAAIELVILLTFGGICGVMGTAANQLRLL